MFYLVDPNLIDRSTVDLWNHPEIKPLFPDPLAEGVRYYNKTGIFPINHGMVIKRELAEKYPWAITNVFKAFVQANEIANRERVAHAEYYFETGLLPPEGRKAIQAPLIAHGVKANRMVLETIAKYSLQQGLTSRQMKLEELFAPSMLEQ